MNKIYLRFAIFITLIAGFILLGNAFSIDVKAIEGFFDKIPLFYSAPAFVLLYIIGTFFLWHLKDPLKIVGVLAFGAYLSTFLIYLAEIASAFIFFNLSKILGKEFVEQKIKGRFKGFYDKLENLNLGWVFLLRAVPLVPYRILDLSFGLSKFPFRKYIWVVLLASLPRIFWIQFILAGVKGLSFQAMNEYFLANRPIFLVSLAYMVISVIIAFRIKKKLK